MKISFRADFDPQPIRHVAVQCPYCSKWFNARDIADDFINSRIDLNFAQFHCPVCDNSFSAYKPSWSSEEQPVMEVEEVSYPDVYKDCLKRREIWE